MDPLRSEAAWGHTAPDLQHRLIQIGNNSFSEHGDFERYVQEKIAEAARMDGFVGAKPHEVGIEIGSGTGVHAKYFADRSRHLFSLDVSSGFSDLFRAYTAELKNLSYEVRPFFPMLSSVPDAIADYCYSTSVFCHLNVYDIYLYFEEIARKLRSGGRLYINFQNSDFGPGSFFKIFLGHYRNGGQFMPIPTTEMQFHSNQFFERVAGEFGFTVAQKNVVESYSEYLWRKD